MKEKMKSIKVFHGVLLYSVLILVLLAGACSNPKSGTAVAEIKAEVSYTCPMHPQIMEDHPGSCPVCGMDLVKKAGAGSKQANVSLNTVLQPVNRSVISTVSSVTPQQKETAINISGEGYLDFDTRTFNNIAARFSGRIEKLYIKYAFQQIHAGQRIFDIYSPDMVTAQQDLVFLIKNSPSETGLISSARQKLLLLGMSSGQINQVIKTGKAFYRLPVYSIYEGHVHDMPHSQMPGSELSATATFASNIPLSIKEGMYVEKGQTMFNVVNPHKLWAVVKIDRSGIASLKLNQPVTITLPDLPGKTIKGKVDFIEPVLQDGDKTTSIRVYLDNMDHALKVNTIVSANIQTGKVSGLWIPRSAVLNLGRSRVVFLKKGALYQTQKVTTGMISGNQIQVTRGLSLPDSLASDAQYLTDSESFIKIQGHE
jgi:Cu(I)/Ag(I) efflux system membrane fusion protein